jgi:NDP-sugar pyrophosphorylase family protein
VFIDEDVIIGEGTTIEHGAMIKGPTIIGRNCEIRKGAYFRGNVVIGDDCIIGNSTELKNCVVLNKAQICHFNYVGDSVLGEGAHLSAGVITSNLKLDQKEVVVRNQENSIETGLKKFGSIVGDYCEVGCNVVLNPGSILGKRCVIYPGAIIRGVVPAEHIVKLVQERLIVHKA